MSIEYTPITPRSGGLVHAIRFTSPRLTACSRDPSGWKIALTALTALTCPTCMTAVGQR